MKLELTASMVGLLIGTIDRRIANDRDVIEMFIEDGDIKDAQEWLRDVKDLRTTRYQLVTQSGINPNKGK